MTKFKGFTLAEVLITLGIIGVVAAMTMPTLINSTQGAQYKTAYKKALSVMSQAVVMNIALEDYDLSQTVAGTNPAAANSAATGVQSIHDLFRNRMNVVKDTSTADFQGTTDGAADTYKIIAVNDESKNDYEDFAGRHVTNSGRAFPELTAGSPWPTGLAMLFYNDGITFIFDNEQGDCRQGTIATPGDEFCFGFLDVNGQKAPNRVVACDSGTIQNGDTDNGTCTVTNPTDIYPIALYDQSIVPASAAARAVLYAK